MEVDTIIIGQGLAGSMLALTMLQEGLAVMVINVEEENSSSKVAAGIVNPITGKRIVKTWMADQLFAMIPSYYASLETLLGTTFFYPKKIYKPFDSVSEQNDCHAKSGPDDYASYMNIDPNHELYSDFIHNPLGGFEINGGGYLDTNAFLDATKAYLLKTNRLINKKVAFEDLLLSENGLSLGSIKATNLVFCEGHRLNQNPYFNWLPLAPAKGEVLSIKSKAIKTDNAISRGIFILPTKECIFKVGATYAWTFDDIAPTAKARLALTTKLDELLKVPYEVVAHQAGIRPATKNRRPLLGQHPDYPQLGVFNGFGSKGVSLIPYFAQHYCQFLKNKAELLPDVNITQYLSLYLKTKN
jgi:glycine oxidase